MKIAALTALEILDSRGRPTVQATCALDGGAAGTASVPSGASTGTNEARELRDQDPTRYAGLGCRKAVSAIEQEIADTLCGRSIRSQQQLDRALIDLDGTVNKSRLGANTILSVSLAFARAVAADRQRPLYAHFADLVNESPQALPRPEINLFSGGRHAGGQIAVQDVLIIPETASRMDDALAIMFDVYREAARLVLDRYGMRELKADEGGLAPPFPDVDQMLAEAVEAAGGADVTLGVDVAASQFRSDQGYVVDGRPLESSGMVSRLLEWVRDYPIVALEDGLAEDDWGAWAALHAEVGDSVLVTGDDLLCTSSARVERAVRERAANTLLLKLNQVGTVTEAAEARRVAREAGWKVIASARSGETEDDWLADLAVGWSADLIKIGSIRQSERLAKYNRLLAIERETRLSLAAL